MYFCGDQKPERLERSVETKVNGDSKSTNESGPSLVGSLGLPCRYKRFSSWLGCSSRPNSKLFFRTVHYFYSFVTIAHSKLGTVGRQPWLGHLSRSLVSLSKTKHQSLAGHYYHYHSLTNYNWFVA
jgi:hypothetical protein